MAAASAWICARHLKKAGETDERIFALAAWPDAPYFTDAERAALALAEAATRLSDRADLVPDEIWEEATQHYDEKALAALIIGISLINVWNRLNVTTRQGGGRVGEIGGGTELGGKRLGRPLSVPNLTARSSQPHAVTARSASRQPGVPKSRTWRRFSFLVFRSQRWQHVRLVEKRKVPRPWSGREG